MAANPALVPISGNFVTTHTASVGKFNVTADVIVSATIPVGDGDFSSGITINLGGEIDTALGKQVLSVVTSSLSSSSQTGTISSDKVFGYYFTVSLTYTAPGDDAPGSLELNSVTICHDVQGTVTTVWSQEFDTVVLSWTSAGNVVM